MSNTSETVIANSVTLQIDAEQYSAAVVEFAVDMAATLQKPLHGRFIEDSTLLQISDLPCSKEICSLSAVEHEISADSMKRSLRASAEIFRKTLAQVARQSSINWSYDYISSNNEPADQAQTAPPTTARHTGYVIYQRSSKLRVNPLHKAKQRILVVDHSSSLLADALKALLHKLKDRNLEIIFATNTSPTTAVQLLLGAEQTSNTLVTNIAMQELIEPGQTGDRLRALDCALIAETGDIATTNSILEHLRCPVVVVSDSIIT